MYLCSAKEWSFNKLKAAPGSGTLVPPRTFLWRCLSPTSRGSCKQGAARKIFSLVIFVPKRKSEIIDADKFVKDKFYDG